jgi:hypothetical protein
MKSLIKSALVTVMLVINLEASTLVDNQTLRLPVYFADSEITVSEVKSAIYYSIDSDGKIISFEKIGRDSFAEDFVLIQEMTGDELFSHLSIYLKNGEKKSFRVVSNTLVPLNS